MKPLARLAALLLAACAAVTLTPHQQALHWLERGDAALSVNDFAHAAPCYREASRLEPQMWQVPQREGLILARTGHPQQALAAWAQAERLNPDATDVLLVEGELLVRLGRPNDARPVLFRALRAAPGCQPALLLLAQASDPRAARRWLGHALEVNPYGGQTWLALSRLDAAEGRWAQVEDDCRRAQDDMPATAALADTQAGVAAAARHRDDEAMTLYRSAIQLDPYQPDARLGLGSLLLHRNPQEARLQLETCLRLTPEGPYADSARRLLESLPK